MSTSNDAQTLIHPIGMKNRQQRRAEAARNKNKQRCDANRTPKSLQFVNPREWKRRKEQAKLNRQ